MQKVLFNDLGLIDYKETWDFQEQLFKETIDIKIQNRKDDTNTPTQHHLLFANIHTFIHLAKVAMKHICYFRKLC